MDKAKGTARNKGLLLLVLWMIFGGAIGYTFASDMVKIPPGYTWSPSVFYEYDLLFGLLALIALILTLLTVFGLMRFSSLSGGVNEDAEGDSPQEQALGKNLRVSSYNTIITLLWITLSFAHALAPGGKGSEDENFMLANMITALVFMLLAIFLQRQTFVQYNRCYPERQMNLRAGNQGQSQRELFAKMDEGEQWIVYRSTYAAFRATSISLIAGIFLLALYSLFFGFTPVPMIVMAIVLLIQQSTYFREVNKYSK